MATARISTTAISGNTNDSNNNGHNNVILASSRLVPLFGSMTVAHQTRAKVLELLNDTIINRNKQSSTQKRDSSLERAMIVDISATTWNWDTYAIVAGSPEPIKVVFRDKDTLLQHLTLLNSKCKEEDKEIVQKGVLVPQKSSQDDNSKEEEVMVWVPKGAILRDSKPTNNGDATEFIFEPLVDPNNDRLEHFEQQVVGKKLIYRQRAKLAVECMRNMLRFYNLDRIICWDLSWGIWEAVRDEENSSSSSTATAEEDGFPCMTLIKHHNNDKIPFPSLDGNNDDDDAIKLFYECCRPITPKLLASTLTSVSGYYLVGGNTYTMSLFHHMWDQHEQGEKGGENNRNGHMQLLRDLLADGKIFYLGHSAGAIMSGPNILTATLKGIDAFSIVTQPYLKPFLKLPPSESPETFFASEKNNLLESRTQMLEKMQQYGAWRGYNVVEALAFPHYDSRPRFESFPQSAETYLRATDERGRFLQTAVSLLVGKDKDDRVESPYVKKVREETNTRQLPCYPIANGHCIVLPCGGLQVVEALSPEEEGKGTLHWDTYMPNVPDKHYYQYATGRTQFTTGSFTDDANTMAGDRSSSLLYNGARIFSRLACLGLPNPGDDEKGGMFRS